MPFLSVTWYGPLVVRVLCRVGLLGALLAGGCAKACGMRDTTTITVASSHARTIPAAKALRAVGRAFSRFRNCKDFRPEQIAPALTEVLWPQLISYTACIIVLSTRLMETRAILVTGLCVIAIGCFFDLPITSDWIVANLDRGAGQSAVRRARVEIFDALQDRTQPR